MVLVIGGTGDLGGRVARALRERGETVQCLVRPGRDDAQLRDRGLVPVPGDLTDPASLVLACPPGGTVVVTATAIGRKLGGERGTSLRAVDRFGVLDLVDAAERADVSRFVYVSFAGIERAQLDFPLERAKRAVEERLRHTGMRSVIVRPDVFQEVHLGPVGRFDVAAGRVAVIGTGDNPRRWVATEDVAALIAAAATEPEPPAVVEFGGPEALTRNEAIVVAEELTGRTFRRQRLPRQAARVAMRLLDRPNDAMASVIGIGLHMDLVTADWDDAPLRQRGVAPRSASAFIRGQARAG